MDLTELDILATTIPGLENIALDEVEEIIGSKGRKEHRGMIRFEGCETDIFRLNYISKTLHRILILINEFSFSELNDIYERVSTLDFTRVMNSDQSFAVRINRHGEHDFTSVNVESEVGQAVIDSFRRSRGKRLEVDLDNPDIIFRGEVRNKRFWLSIDTTGKDSLHKRSYRVSNHPAPLKPTIANSLVRLSGWDNDESLIDPMCGTGTICIEAALKSDGRPNLFENDLDLFNLEFLDLEKFSEMKKEHEKDKNYCDLTIFGRDISESYLEVAKKNADRANVDIDFDVADARDLELNYDRVITNLPFGVRMGDKNESRELCEDFVNNLMDFDWKKAIVLSDFSGLFPNDFLERTIEIRYGNRPVKIFILDRNL